MPTYEYVCKSCGHALEVFQSMTEAPKRKCPECGRSALERKIGTGAAVLFKGSGFYQTDYRSESYKKASEAEKKPAEAKPEGGFKGKSEGKTDAPKSEPAKAPGSKPRKSEASRAKPKRGADAA
jgi:putative FmdB family regulatory protein